MTAAPTPPLDEIHEELVQRHMANVGDGPIRFASDGEDGTVVVDRRDYEQMFRANLARQLHEPFNPSDELAPARQEPGGPVVGAVASGIGFIPQEVLERPGFDLHEMQSQMLGA